MKFETTGGDPVQQARRAAMWSQYERPDYWLNLSEQAFIHSMRKTGNQPDRELANIVGFLVKAAEYGSDPNGGFLAEKLAPRIEAEPPDLAEIWRAVCTALELLAQQRIVVHNAAAVDEAIEAMTPAAQAA